MRLAYLSVLLIASGAPALAQKTTCRWIGQVWTCNSSSPNSAVNPLPFIANTPDPGQAFLQSYNAARQQREQQEERERAESYARAQAEINQQRTNQAAQLRKDVGRLIADGDCLGAKSLALSSGDLALASEVKAYCAAP